MILCDCCEHWYHCDCLGLEDSQVDFFVNENIDFISLHHMATFLIISFIPPSFLWGEVPGSQFE